MNVASQQKPPGSHDLQPLPTKTLSVHAHNEQIDQIYNILKGLPVEEPPGSEDIYGLDTGVTWMGDRLEWSNGGPEGCGSDFSDVQVGKEEKDRFQKVVKLILEIVKTSE